MLSMLADASVLVGILNSQCKNLYFNFGGHSHLVNLEFTEVINFYD